MKQQKSTFNSYNLFLDVILVQNMVNVFLNTHILRSTPSIIMKMSAQEYESEVEKNCSVLSAILIIPRVDFDQAFVKTFN